MRHACDLYEVSLFRPPEGFQHPDLFREVSQHVPHRSRRPRSCFGTASEMAASNASYRVHGAIVDIVPETADGRNGPVRAPQTNCLSDFAGQSIKWTGNDRGGPAVLFSEVFELCMWFLD